MPVQFIGELRIFGFNNYPNGWSLCDGSTLQISAYKALFDLIGNAYGGDGVTNFKLPNLQGAVPMNTGPKSIRGQKGGEQQHVLTIREMPSHTHQAVASSNSPDRNTPTSNYWASNTGYTPYGRKKTIQWINIPLDHKVVIRLMKIWPLTSY